MRCRPAKEVHLHSEDPLIGQRRRGNVKRGCQQEAPSRRYRVPELVGGAPLFRPFWAKGGAFRACALLDSRFCSARRGGTGGQVSSQQFSIHYQQSSEHREPRSQPTQSRTRTVQCLTYSGACSRRKITRPSTTWSHRAVVKFVPKGRAAIGPIFRSSPRER